MYHRQLRIRSFQSKFRMTDSLKQNSWFVLPRADIVLVGIVRESCEVDGWILMSFIFASRLKSANNLPIDPHDTLLSTTKRDILVS